MYTPARTRTLVLWLLGLALAVFGGLAVGHSNSSYALGPEFGPYPEFERSSPIPTMSIGGSTSLNDPYPYSSATPATTQSSFEPCEETDKNGRCVELTPVVTTAETDASKEAAGHMSGAPKRPASPSQTSAQPSEKPAAELPPAVGTTAPPAVTTPPVVAEPEPLLCTSPNVECACDHYLAGCTGGFPPDGEGTPNPEPEPIVCQDGEVFDPEFGCVRTQLPEEIIGREVEGPNGERCFVIDVDGNLDCTVREDILVD